MFADKYKPASLENIVGNKQCILGLQTWFENWGSENQIPNTKSKESKSKNICALLSGTNGIGKTLAIELFIKKYDLNPITLSPDDKNDKEYIIKTILPSLQIKNSFSKKQNVFVIHDIDCYDDYGFISCIVNCFKETKIPVLATCNNRYDQCLKPIISYCFDIKFQKLMVSEIIQFLKSIIKTERISASEIILKQMIEDFDCDLRSILNNLQFYNSITSVKTNVSSKDKTNTNIFEVTKLFMSQNIEMSDKQTLFWLNNDLLPLMIHENYPYNNIKMKNEVSYLNNIAETVHNLSDLDIFEKEIHTNGSWELLPYTQWLSIKAVENCHSKTQINFTTFFEKRANKKQNSSGDNVKKNSKAPKAEKVPKVPKAAKEPKIPKAPKVAKAPKEPKAVKVPKVPKTPKAKDPPKPSNKKKVKLIIEE